MTKLTSEVNSAHLEGLDYVFTLPSSANEGFLLVFHQQLEKRAKIDFCRICFYLIHWRKSAQDEPGNSRIAPTAVVSIFPCNFEMTWA